MKSMTKQLFVKTHAQWLLRTVAADKAKNLRLLAIPAVVVPVDIVTV